MERDTREQHPENEKASQGESHGFAETLPADRVGWEKLVEADEVPAENTDETPVAEHG